MVFIQTHNVFKLYENLLIPANFNCLDFLSSIGGYKNLPNENQLLLSLTWFEKSFGEET